MQAQEVTALNRLYSIPTGREYRVNWRGMDDVELRIAEERRLVEAEYRRVLKSAVEFEKRIRNRWRVKNRVKNERIAELESRVTELERRLESMENRGGNDGS